MASRYLLLASLFLFSQIVLTACAQQVSTLTPPFGASGDVAVGPDGRVYVGDFGESLGQGINGAYVYRVTPDGETEIFAEGFRGASGNTFDAAGNLYQSDIMNQRVVRIAPDGAIDTFMEGPYRGLIGNTFDAEGNLYVTECEANRILRVAPGGGAAESFATSDLFNCPNGLTTGPDGHLYAVNFFDAAMVKITVPSGEVTFFAAIPGGGNGHLTSSNGQFYIAAFRANQIYAVTLDGQVLLLAGTGSAGNEDGPASRATFYKPNGIAASSTGDTLYVNTTAEVDTFRQLHPNFLRMITGVKAALPPEE